MSGENAIKGQLNVTQKLINSHLVAGQPRAGEEIGLRIDQTLTQDATGTLVMLELQAMHLERVQTELSVQYVDHNLIQEDYKNADDHLFLLSACQRFGLWYSRPGNGVSHPVHMERFGRPGKTLLGADSHTCAAGALGMLAMGAGGLEVAMAMAGQPFYIKMPEIWGIELSGQMPDWVSAKDLILELLRRHDVKGGVGRIIEYHGPGLAQLSAMDRHVVANMGAELGATTSVFPADHAVRRYLRAQRREQDYVELVADQGCHYDLHEQINLSELEPLIAKPSSPGNVVPVREVAGLPLYQAYIGSSANPGYRDFAICAAMVQGRKMPPNVSFDINPTSRAMLEQLTQDGLIGQLLHAGARLHQAGCNGCIGMGQAPAFGRNSLRTVPRNFPGRSGTREDSVYLCSPETATASALSGVMTDPRTMPMAYPHIAEPENPILNEALLDPPLPLESARNISLVLGNNIQPIPEFEAFPERLELPVLLKMGDNISTDEILPAGARVLPFRSNIPEISKFAFEAFGVDYYRRAKATGNHALVAARNYGQGSSREHAALAPRYLNLRVVLAKSYARIHWQNLINFGILPLQFKHVFDYEFIAENTVLILEDLHQALRSGETLTGQLVCGKDSSDQDRQTMTFSHALSARQIEVLLAGGLINWARNRFTGMK